MKIIKKDHFHMTTFTVDNEELSKTNQMCWFCETNYVENWYSYFLYTLKQKELIPKLYKPICCRCYELIREWGYTYPTQEKKQIKLKKKLKQNTP